MPLPINDIQDGFKVVEALKNALEAARRDDGEVSRTEYLTIAFSVLQPTLNFVEGIENVLPQINDLDEEELKQLRDQGYGKIIDNPYAVNAVYHLSAAAIAIKDWAKSGQDIGVIS